MLPLRRRLPGLVKIIQSTPYRAWLPGVFLIVLPLSCLNAALSEEHGDVWDAHWDMALAKGPPAEAQKISFDGMQFRSDIAG